MIFQLTTSRRGRPITRAMVRELDDFNSRPHEEVDWARGGTLTLGGIFQLTTSRRGRRLKKHFSRNTAIFQLTTSRRGRLNADFNAARNIAISTHDLTKRSTQMKGKNPQEEIFQLTTSRRGRQYRRRWYEWVLAFQLTTSRRGRHYGLGSFESGFAFQLTTSRRGRLLTARQRYGFRHFNSRPHEEVDQ